MIKALVMDFETTGLTLHPDAKPHLQPRAIEFAGTLIDSAGETLDELNFLIHPGELVSAEITKITGITNEMLADAKPFTDHLEELRALFAKADVLIAHNLPFDRAIMAHELKLASITDWPWPRVELCTVGVFEPIWGRRPRLIELYQSVMGHPYQQTHRALDDVSALVQIVLTESLLDLIPPAASSPN